MLGGEKGMEYEIHVDWRVGATVRGCVLNELGTEYGVF